MKLADYFGMYLAKVATQDNRVFVLDGDLADSDGAEQFVKVHPSKFLMGGIAEQSLVSVAAGMASCGIRPFVFSFSAFLTFRAYDQIRLCLSQAKQPVVLVGSHAGGLTGRNGKSHAALNDIALIHTLPNIRIWAPADYADVEFCVDEILASDLPAYVRLPRKNFAEAFRLPGKVGIYRWLKPFSAVNVVATGLGTLWAEEACAMASTQGAEVGLLHCLSIELPDEILEILSRSRCLIVLEDHYMFGGLGQVLQAKLFCTRVISIGWPISFQGEHGDEQVLRRQNGLSAEQVASVIINESSGGGMAGQWHSLKLLH